MRSLRHGIWVLLVIFALIAAACGDDDEGVTTTAPPPAPTTTEPTPDPTTTTETPPPPTTEAPPAPTTTTTEAPIELTRVRYGLPTRTYFITTVGVQFALQNGFFEDEGLDVTVDPLPGSTTAIRSMLSGNHDIVLTGGDTAYNAWANGAPVKIISSPISKGTDVLFVNSDIETIADIKRFGITEPGSTVDVLGRIIFERNGVDPDDVEFLTVGSPSDRVAAMIAGNIDGTAATILTLVPVIEAIEAGEMKVLTSFAEEFPNIPLAYNVSTDRFVEENPDVVEAFLRAEIRGYCWAQENPEQAAAIAFNFIEETPLELLEEGLRGMAGLRVFGLDGGITEEGIAATQEALISLGRLDETVEVNDVAVFELVESAAAAVDCQA